jgi:hypothetical protein
VVKLCRRRNSTSVGPVLNQGSFASSEVAPARGVCLVRSPTAEATGLLTWQQLS